MNLKLNREYREEAMLIKKRRKIKTNSVVQLTQFINI